MSFYQKKRQKKEKIKPGHDFTVAELVQVNFPQALQ